MGLLAMAGLDRLLLSFIAASNGLRFFPVPEVSPDATPVWGKEELKNIVRQDSSPGNSLVSGIGLIIHVVDYL